MSPTSRASLPIIGWREWVSLPDLGIPTIKAKVDTGARSSSLHAIEVEEFEQDGEEWVRFQVHPTQRRTRGVIEASARVLDHRSVRSSSGRSAWRPVILTSVGLLGVVWEVEVTLANRTQMGFRMLLGRQAVRRRFLVDPGKSYLAGKRERKERTAAAKKRKGAAKKKLTKKKAAAQKKTTNKATAKGKSVAKKKGKKAQKKTVQKMTVQKKKTPKKAAPKKAVPKKKSTKKKSTKKTARKKTTRKKTRISRSKK